MSDLSTNCSKNQQDHLTAPFAQPIATKPQQEYTSSSENEHVSTDASNIWSEFDSPTSSVMDSASSISSPVQKGTLESLYSTPSSQKSTRSSKSSFASTMSADSEEAVKKRKGSKSKTGETRKMTTAESSKSSKTDSKNLKKLGKSAVQKEQGLTHQEDTAVMFEKVSSNTDESLLNKCSPTKSNYTAKIEEPDGKLYHVGPTYHNENTVSDNIDKAEYATKENAVAQLSENSTSEQTVTTILRRVRISNRLENNACDDLNNVTGETFASTQASCSKTQDPTIISQNKITVAAEKAVSEQDSESKKITDEVRMHESKITDSNSSWAIDKEPVQGSDFLAQNVSPITTENLCDKIDEDITSKEVEVITDTCFLPKVDCTASNGLGLAQKKYISIESSLCKSIVQNSPSITIAPIEQQLRILNNQWKPRGKPDIFTQRGQNVSTKHSDTSSDEEFTAQRKNKRPLSYSDDDENDGVCAKISCSQNVKLLLATQRQLKGEQEKLNLRTAEVNDLHRRMTDMRKELLQYKNKYEVIVKSVESITCASQNIMKCLTLERNIASSFHKARSSTTDGYYSGTSFETCNTSTSLSSTQKRKSHKKIKIVSSDDSDETAEAVSCDHKKPKLSVSGDDGMEFSTSVQKKSRKRLSLHSQDSDTCHLQSKEKKQKKTTCGSFDFDHYVRKNYKGSIEYNLSDRDVTDICRSRILKMGKKALQSIVRDLFSRLFDGDIVCYCTSTGKDDRLPLDMNKKLLIIGICAQAGFGSERVPDINQELNKCCHLERKKAGRMPYDPAIHKDLVKEYNRKEEELAIERRRKFQEEQK